MAATEIQGSGKTRDQLGRRYITRLLVSTAATDKAAIGTAYPADTGNTARLCIQSEADLTVLEGIAHITEVYMGFVAKA